MTYKINDYVKITKTEEIKQVVDYELIENYTILYMSDNTSYCNSDVCKINEVEFLLDYFKSNSNQIIKKIISDQEESIDRMATTIANRIKEREEREERERKKTLLQKLFSIFS
jgi:hypothetical protein